MPTRRLARSRLASSRLARSRFAPLVIAAALAGGGCAGSICKRVAADRQDFLARAATSADPHMVIVLPFAALSQEISRKLTRVPALKVPLGSVGVGGFDLDLGALSAKLAGITVIPAADEQIAFRVGITLMNGAQAVVTLDLEAAVRPQLDVAGGAVHVKVTAADVARVKPSIAPAERKRLGDFLYKKVPPMAQRFVDRGSVDAIVSRLSGDLLGRSWPLIRDNLLGNIGALTEFSIDLPDLPITALHLRSRGADLALAVHTSLPAAGLAGDPGRASGTAAALPQIRISGQAIAELANDAMRKGTIPSRYTRDGAPSPTGEFEAGVTWEAGPRPLKLHAWCTTGTCAYVQFGGTPTVRASAGVVTLAVADGKIEETRGSAKVRAAVWFSGLGRQTFQISESAAASVRFELFGATMRASAVAATIEGDELALAVALTEERPAGRR